MEKLGRILIGIVLVVLAIKAIGLFFAVARIAIGLAIIIGVGAALTGRWNQYVDSLKRIVGMQ
ncbi:MAG: hypothetical protein ACM3ZQ_03775 [Bacillota bacterium]